MMTKDERNSTTDRYMDKQSSLDTQPLLHVTPTVLAPGYALDNKYTIIKLLAQGGMGAVYLAEQNSLRRKVAIKVIKSGSSSEDEETILSKRFMNEASVMASIEHPSVVRIFDFAKTQDNMHYIVMEYINGVDLHAFVKQQGALSIMQVFDIAEQLSSALVDIHSKGIVHRDIKPANILVVAQPEQKIQVKLIDFGLGKDNENQAKLTQTGQVIGSPMYMAPEQINMGSDNIDSYTDIYSLGLSLFYTVLGEEPYTFQNLTQLIFAQLKQEPKALQTRTDIPIGLQQILNCCVQKSPDKRYKTALALYQDLSKVYVQYRTELPTQQLQLDAMQAESNETLVLSDLLENSVLQENKQDSHFDNKMDKKNITSASNAQNSGTKLPVDTLAQQSLAMQPVQNQTVGSLQNSTRYQYTIGLVLLVLVVVSIWSVENDIQPIVPQETQMSTVGVPTTVLELSQTTPSTTTMVIVNSIPENVDVYKEDKLIGSTPLEMSVKNDQEIEVELRKKGYLTKKVTLLSTITKLKIVLDQEPQDIQSTVSSKPTFSSGTKEKNIDLETTTEESKKMDNKMDNKQDLLNPWSK